MLERIGGVCLSLILFTTPTLAQTQPQPQRPPGALPQKTPPRPPATAPATSPYCMFESKEYSVGAVLCVSNHMSQVCTASDAEHTRSWWSSGPQPLCSSAAFPPRSTPSPITPEATPKSALPSLPSEATPKSAPPSFPSEPNKKSTPSLPQTEPSMPTGEP